MKNKETIIQKYVSLGYSIHYVHGYAGPGCILKHPGFDNFEGELEHSLPIAEIYAKHGNLVVLTPPDINALGNHVKSPDGFINQETNRAEFKHASTGTVNNIKFQIKAAGKKGKNLLRVIWISNDATPEIIAQILAGKYRQAILSKNTMIDIDRVDLLYQERLIHLTRADYEAEGYEGLLKLIQ